MNVDKSFKSIPQRNSDENDTLKTTTEIKKTSLYSIAHLIQTQMKEKRKNNFIIFRVSDEQKKFIQTHAKKNEMSSSAFVRNTFIQVIKTYSNEARV